MPLTPEQRAELDALGPEIVRAKLKGAYHGPAAAVPGFKSGGDSQHLTRVDIEDWLWEQKAKPTGYQGSILLQATFWAAIFSVLVGAVHLFVTVWVTGAR